MFDFLKYQITREEISIVEMKIQRWMCNKSKERKDVR